MRAFLAVLALGFGLSTLRADEVKVELKDVPKAVLETVKKRFPKAELIEAAKETDGTKVEFEVSLKDGETKYDVMLTPDGKITLIEKTIALKDLPKAVVEAIEKAYPKATHTLAEEMTKVIDGKEVLSYYEVRLTTADKKLLEVEVSPEGKIIKFEDKSAEAPAKK